MPALAETSRRAGDFLTRHDAGVHVRQQRGFLQHQRAHCPQVADRRVVPQFRQSLPRRAVAKFGLVAEGEQRLGAARRLTRAGDGQHLVGGQIYRMPGAGAFGEGAVVTDVTAQLRQRNEHLPRVGNRPPERGIPLGRGLRHQFRQGSSFHPGVHSLLTTSSANRCCVSSVFSIVGCCR